MDRAIGNISQSPYIWAECENCEETTWVYAEADHPVVCYPCQVKEGNP